MKGVSDFNPNGLAFKLYSQSYTIRGRAILVSKTDHIIFIQGMYLAHSLQVLATAIQHSDLQLLGKSKPH